MDQKNNHVLVNGKEAIKDFCHRFRVDEPTCREILDLWRNFETHEERVFAINVRTKERQAYQLLFDLSLHETTLVKAYCTKYPCMEGTTGSGLRQMFLLRQKIHEVIASKLNPSSDEFLGYY